MPLFCWERPAWRSSPGLWNAARWRNPVKSRLLLYAMLCTSCFNKPCILHSTEASSQSCGHPSHTEIICTSTSTRSLDTFTASHFQTLGNLPYPSDSTCPSTTPRSTLADTALAFTFAFAFAFAFNRTFLIASLPLHLCSSHTMREPPASPGRRATAFPLCAADAFT